MDNAADLHGKQFLVKPAFFTHRKGVETENPTRRRASQQTGSYLAWHQPGAFVTLLRIKTFISVQIHAFHQRNLYLGKKESKI